MCKDSKCLVLLFICLLLISCGKVNEEKFVEISVPLLKECEAYFVNDLKELSKSEFSDLYYEVVKFSKIISSHPSIIGYVKLRTRRNDEQYLKGIFGRAYIGCYPTSSANLWVQDLGIGFQSTLKTIEEAGTNNYYISTEGGKMRVHYFDKKHIEKMRRKEKEMLEDPKFLDQVVEEILKK